MRSERRSCRCARVRAECRDYMALFQARQVSSSASSAAALVLHLGFIITGVVTTMLGPLLPILISRWSLIDRRAGLFFTAQFCGSMLGVASTGPLIKRGYRQTFVCGFGLIAAGVAGLNLPGYAANLASAAVFGCGLGQTLSAANLWVAEVAGDRLVAAISILNLMWGIGAIVSSPLVMLAQRNGVIPWLFDAIAACSAVTALILASTELGAGGTQPEEEAEKPSLQRRISKRSALSLAALFFLYVGSENSVAGWVASLAKRMNPSSRDVWALAPMLFWAGIIVGRGLVPFVPSRRRERTLLTGGLILSVTGICFLLRSGTFLAVAICVAGAGLGLAAIYPILIAWMVKVFGERSRKIGSIMFALAGLGGATMPSLVGVISTGVGGLRSGLLVPLAGCVAMLALVSLMVEPVFREVTTDANALR